MTRKIAFFEGWSWFKFNNLGLALGTNLTFCTSVVKGLKLKVRRFWGLNHTSVEVTGEKLVGGAFLEGTPSKELYIFYDCMNVISFRENYRQNFRTILSCRHLYHRFNGKNYFCDLANHILLVFRYYIYISR